jgi:serine/threonine-protein kinase
MNAAPAMTQLTQTGMVMGTPQYMSPEQANGQPVDHRTDLYALACVLYQMVVGAPPFDGTDLASIFAMIMSEEPPAVSRRACCAVPVGLDAIVVRAMAKDPDERFDSATDMVEAVRALGPPGEGRRSASAPAPVEVAGGLGPRGALTAPSAHPVAASPALDRHLVTSRPLATQPAVHPLVAPPSGGPGAEGSAAHFAAGVSAPPLTAGVETAPGFGGLGTPPPGGASVPPPVVRGAPRRLGSVAFFAVVAFVGAFVLVASASLTWWYVTTRRERGDDGSEGRAVTDSAGDAGAVAVASARDAGPASPVAVAPPPAVLPPPVLPPLPPPPPEIATPPGVPPPGAVGPVQPATPDAGATAAPNPAGPATPPASARAPAKAPATAEESLDRASRAAARGDFQGCLRELRGAPQTARVLTTRLACAQSAGDRAEATRTCSTIRSRYPASPQAAGCGLVTGLPIRLPF